MNDAFSKIGRLDREGNFNGAVAAAVENYRDLGLVRPEVLQRIAHYLRRFRPLLSPQTIDTIRTLPASHLAHAGLADLLEAGFTGEGQGPSIGKIVFPVVTSFGLVREILVTDGGNENLSSGRLQVLDRAGSATFKIIGQRLGTHCIWMPDRFSFTILDPYGKDDPAVEGDSMSLPLAIALYSRATGVPVPHDLSATALLGRDGSMEPVASLEKKLEVLARERFFLRRVLVSARQETRDAPPGIEIIMVDSLKEALSVVFPNRPEKACFTGDVDLGAEMRSLNFQYDGYLIDTCMDNADELIRYLKSRKLALPKEKAVRALFTCYWKKGSCHCHKGEVKNTKKYLKKALDLYRKNPGLIRADDYYDARISQAVLLKDIFRYTDAEDIHVSLDQEMHRSRSLNHIKGKNLSTLSQLYLAMGRFEEAERCQRRAISLINTEEVCRNYGYLAQIHTRNGEFLKAASALSRYSRLLETSDEKTCGAHTPFYHWIRAEYLFKRGVAFPKGRPRFFRDLYGIAERYPEPEWWAPCLIHKFSGLAHLVQGEDARGLAELDRVVRYFSNQFAHVLRLLGASVRAERARYFFSAGRHEQASEDIDGIIEDLSLQKDMKRFFRPRLSLLSSFLKSGKPGAKSIDKAFSALKEIIAGIPY